MASDNERAIGRAGGIRAVSLLLHKTGNVSRISWAGAIQSGVQICVAHYDSRMAAITTYGCVCIWLCLEFIVDTTLFHKVTIVLPLPTWVFISRRSNLELRANNAFIETSYLLLV
jgi:hypothetical protein